VTDSGEEE
jgi:hypothetical protein